MFDRVGSLAEKLATNVSRRDFFGWAGKSALALAGVLAMGGIARANSPSCATVATVPAGTSCPGGTQPCGGALGVTFCIPANGCKCCFACGVYFGSKEGCPKRGGGCS
jgi:hypothetical protein